jgi:hypothetical protein
LFVSMGHKKNHPRQRWVVKSVFGPPNTGSATERSQSEK